MVYRLRTNQLQINVHPTVAVCADPEDDNFLLAESERLAGDLKLPLLDQLQNRDIEMILAATPTRLELRIVGGDPLLCGGRPVYVNLDKIDTRSSAGRRVRQPLAKAVGLSHRASAPTIIDATAGYGEDAYLLAGLGCQVLAIERQPLVVALCRDGLLRADAVLDPGGHGRIHLVQADSYHVLNGLIKRSSIRGGLDLPAYLKHFIVPDVVYLDPMFPPTRKAAERKPMRVLRRLVGDDCDADQLLQVALKVARKRVVIKRPLHGPFLADRPTTVHKGNATRYDVYMT